MKTAFEIVGMLINGNVKDAIEGATKLPFRDLEAAAIKHRVVDAYSTACYLKGTVSWVRYCHEQNPRKKEYSICAICNQEVMKKHCGRYGNEMICEDCEAKSDQPGDE